MPHFARLAVFVNRFLWDYNGKPLFKDRHRQKFDPAEAGYLLLFTSYWLLIHLLVTDSVYWLLIRFTGY